MRAMIVAGALTMVCVSTASAQPEEGTARWVMPGCRAALAGTGGQRHGTLDGFMKVGICMGSILSVGDLGILFDQICLPRGVDYHPLRVVVDYIDAHPDRQWERFSYLALEALKTKWPCRK